MQPFTRKRRKLKNKPSKILPIGVEEKQQGNHSKIEN